MPVMVGVLFLSVMLTLPPERVIVLMLSTSSTPLAVALMFSSPPETVSLLVDCLESRMPVSALTVTLAVLEIFSSEDEAPR